MNKLNVRGQGKISVGVLFFFIFFVVLFALNIQVTCAAQAKESCVTDKCHSNMGKANFVHGPVAVGECLVCHQKTGDHKFAPIKHENEEKLCYKCHPDRVNKTKGSHKQVNGSYCSKCHDPHQSQFNYQLRTKNGN